MFFPGETVAHRFTINILKDGIGRILVTYKQDNKTILQKSVYFGDIEEDYAKRCCYFTVSLSQEESLLFRNNKDFKIQLNIIFRSGARATSVELDGSNGIQHMRKVVNINAQ